MNGSTGNRDQDEDVWCIMDVWFFNVLIGEGIRNACGGIRARWVEDMNVGILLYAEPDFQGKLDKLYDAMWIMNLKNNIPKTKVQ